jgi:TupA-like ATPgrasp
MNQESVKPEFRIQKPPNWSNLLLYQKIYYYGTKLTPAFAPYVDKIEVKRFVKEIAGDRIKVAPIVRILSGPNDIRNEDVSSNYMLKSTHGSSWNMSITQKTTMEDMKKAMKSWNKPWIHSNERQYSYVKPRFFLEEKIDCIYTGKSGDALDIKIRCIYGRPIFIVFKMNHIVYFYTENWVYLGTQGKPHKDPNIARPTYLDELLSLSLILSKPFEFVRVDFYVAKDGIYFGEYTFTPANGGKQLSDEWERHYGNMWTAS